MLPRMRSLDSQLGLGFLLSLGALPIAGCPPADDSDDTNSSNATNPTANTVSATGDTGSGNPTSLSAGDDTGGDTGTQTASDTGTMTSVSTDTDPTGLDSGSGGELPDECMDIAIPPGCTAYKNKL